MDGDFTPIVHLDHPHLLPPLPVVVGYDPRKGEADGGPKVVHHWVAFEGVDDTVVDVSVMRVEQAGECSPLFHLQACFA